MITFKDRWNPKSPVIWVHVPLHGPVRTAYNMVIESNEGISWKVNKGSEEAREGSLFLFSQPNKYIDVLLVTERNEESFKFSRVFYTILWRDWNKNFLVPFPQNKPVVLFEQHKKIVEYIKEELKKTE